MSFEEELRSQVRQLVAPYGSDDHQAGDIVRRVRARRRARRGALAAVAVVVLLLGGLAWPTLRHAVQPDPGPTTSPPRVTANFNVSGRIYFLSEFKIHFGEARRVAHAVITNRGVRFRTGYYPLDGSDSDQNYPNPLRLAAGTSMVFQSVLLPDCQSVDKGDVVLHVTSLRPNGDRVVDRFTARNRAEFAQLSRRYCRPGVRVRIHGGADRTYRDGRVIFELNVTNLTSRPVTVRSEAYERSYSRWERAAVVVPPRATKLLTITAHMMLDRTCPRNTPWATHHLTVDGKAVGLDQPDSGCEV